MKILIVLTLIASSLMFAQTNAKEEVLIPAWQQSESLNIQLGVRDKNASIESYEAVFSAENTTLGIVYEAKVKVVKDNWGFAYFPNDFPPGVKDGNYTWKCTVNEKVVSSGSFKYGDDQRTLTLPKK